MASTPPTPPSRPPPRLLLAATARKAIFSHAREGLRADDGPREVCGVLVGERTGGRADGGSDEGDGNADGAPDRVTDVRRVPNVAADPRTRYELDPEVTLSAIESVEAAGDDVVGFYHSHPESRARPSATDRREATWEGYVYLVVSPARDELGAWRWTGERFEALDVESAQP
ncbi:desampylase [Haloprofundus halobius]|uniref:desampylase n=1 Tax=Haloprofundus halobius TaxID=2876194 RepID=UPI001CCF0E71|nr:desampylase [Haloprofundus halobius]